MQGEPALNDTVICDVRRVVVAEESVVPDWQVDQQRDQRQAEAKQPRIRFSETPVLRFLRR